MADQYKNPPTGSPSSPVAQICPPGPAYQLSFEKQSTYGSPPGEMSPELIPMTQQSPPYADHSQPQVGFITAPPMPGANSPAPMSVSMPSNCPPGLEYLTQIDQLLVKQQVEVLEILTGFETKNKYQVLNTMGQRIYFAVEKSSCCERQCCGSYRRFKLKILDNSGQEVIRLERPRRCDSCCFPCCLQEMTVYAPTDVMIGRIKQLCNPVRPKFVIMDASDNEILYVRGPICTCDACGEIIFSVLSLDGETEVGQVRKHWSGLVKEIFTDADNFGITFPIDLDVRVKATMLAITFLIDFLYYEETNKDNDCDCLDFDFD